MPFSDGGGVYLIATNSRILTRECSYQTAIKIHGLNRSRLKTTDWLHARLFDDLDAPVHHSDGRPFIVHRDIIDEAYGWTDEFRWNSDIKRFVENYPHRTPNSHLLLRFQLWDLAFKIINDPIKF